MAASPDLNRFDLDSDEFAGLLEEAAEFSISLADPPLVRRAEVHTPDGVVSSLVWGDDDDNPRVVFIHGVALNAHTFDPVILSLGLPAVSIDLPGHGHSGWRVDGSYDPRRMAPQVATVIEQLAPDADLVVGHSLGGLTSIALTDVHEELVRNLLLVDITPGITREGASPVSQFLAGPDSFDSRAEIVISARSFGFGVSDAQVARAVALNTTVRSDGRVVWRHQIGQSPSSVTTVGDFDALWPTLESFRGPVTLLKGERGFLAPAEVDEARTRVPDLRVITADTGHNVQEDDPVALAEVIRAELRRAG